MCDTQSLSCVSPPSSFLSPSRWYVFSFVSSVFSFFKFYCDVFLSHRIPVFLHQTPVVRATACWTPAAIGFDSGSSVAGRFSSSKQFSSSAALHRGRCSAVLGFIIMFHCDDDFSLGVSFFQISDSFSSLT